jgi:UDP-N-acetylmuramyl pentapeptide phosphotransferase/UDP-N-acetylglucosamine-1-phosphate transferase
LELSSLILEVGVVFVVSMLTNLIVVLWFAGSRSKLTKRNDTKAVQASHITPVARIGGISIIIGLAVAAMPFLEKLNSWPQYWLLLISAFPVFLVGLCEDLGYFARPRVRLIAAALSGAAFVALFGQWIPRTDIASLDMAMQWAPIGIGFSLFVATGISHSFNLIDGLNGLAGIIAVGVALSLAAISHQVGLVEYSNTLFALSGAIAGFLVFNFPFGKIFLGDAGAYLIGHLLVWMSISILCVAPSVTPFAMLLIFFWPVADTLLAIARRIYIGKPISHPDRLHFHQLVMRGLEIVFLGRNRRYVTNPLATALTLPFALAPMVLGVLLAFERVQAAIACLYFAAIFIMAYKFIMLLVCRFRRSMWIKESHK